MSYSGIRILTTSPGVGPKQPLVFAFGGGGGTVRKESPSLLGPFGLPSWGGLPFLVSPDWRGSIFIFLLVFGVECVAELSDDESDTTWRRELFRVPLAFLVFSGTL